MKDQKISDKFKTDVLIEEMMDNSGKSREELVWEAIQHLWYREDDYRGNS